MDDFIVIEVFNEPNEMFIAKNYLESEGYVCFSRDEHILSINPIYSNAIGGVKLLVHRDCASEAKLKLNGYLQRNTLKVIDKPTSEQLFLKYAWPPLKIALMILLFPITILYFLFREKNPTSEKP